MASNTVLELSSPRIQTDGTRFLDAAVAVSIKLLMRFLQVGLKQTPNRQITTLISVPCSVRKLVTVD